jgi:hypothetical protein
MLTAAGDAKRSARAARECVEHIDAILEAMQRVAREALLRHKREGRPIMVWRDGRVEWIQPEDFPVDDTPKQE